jgi:hypothetical protein
MDGVLTMCRERVLRAARIMWVIAQVIAVVITLLHAI